MPVTELTKALTLNKPQEICSYSCPEFLVEMVVRNKQTFFLKYDRQTGKIEELSKLILPRGGSPLLPFKESDNRLMACLWPSGAEEYGTDKELVEEIKNFIHKWADLEPEYELIVIFYTLFTYIYEEFYEVPYLRILADIGSGKSRMGIDVLGSIVCRGIRTIAVSSIASLFRLLHSLRGTLIMDEADLKEQGEKTSDIVQMLNSGYKAGIYIMRCEKKGNSQTKYTTESFNVFGPKIIMSREHIKDNALESRCIPIKMTETERKDIPLLVDNTLEEEAQILRNKLLMWKFRNFGKRRITIDDRFNDLKISSRTKQLLLLLSSVIEDNDIKEMLLLYGLNLHQENTALRGESVSGEVLEAIKRIMETKEKDLIGYYFIYLKELFLQVNQGRLSRDKEISSRYISHLCRETLNLKPDRKDNGRGFIFNLKEINALLEKYNLGKIYESENDNL